jgi:hypothetical protein
MSSGEQHPGAYALSGFTLGMAQDCVGKGWHPLLEVLFCYLEDRKQIGSGTIAADCPPPPPYKAPKVVRCHSEDGALKIHMIEGDVFDRGVLKGVEMLSRLISEHVMAQPPKWAPTGGWQ